jgi:glycosyltransferase involved in cell wall biosynthesis
MKLAAVSRILNEADIAESFIRHTAHFVDHHVLIDNGSVDGTLRILESLRDEGFPLTIFQNRASRFVEERINTFLYQTAVNSTKADWIVFLDADEFIDDRLVVPSLRDCLEAFATRHGEEACVDVHVCEYHPTPNDPSELVVPQRIRFGNPPTRNIKVIVPAVLIRRQATIQPGNHSVLIDGGKPCPSFTEPTLRYAHFAYRSPYQWISKFVIGWAKVLAAGPETVKAGHNQHYREPFELLRTDPQAILRNPDLMQLRPPPADAALDPIVYRGGSLIYTATPDYTMRAVQVMMQYLFELAGQNGDLREMVNQLGAALVRQDGGISRLM